MTLDIIFSGIGGQGIVTASDILCETALLEGLNVTKAEIHGVAQRGGSVIAHVRIGKDKIPCLLIEKGTADILVGFEILETVRALPMMKDNCEIIVNTNLIPPTPALQGLATSPSKNELIEILKKKTNRLFEIDALRYALEAGDASSANIVLLGALFSKLDIPINDNSIQKALSSKLMTKHPDLNFRALQLGRKACNENEKQGVGDQQ